ncbi:MAG: DMT family transporter [Chloroflexi bacterium]|nr:DMT family transporter [Chloroflexota bacterium]
MEPVSLTYVAIAALAWAISAPAIESGIYYVGTSWRHISLGLCLAFAIGSILLTFVVTKPLLVPPVLSSLYLILAGILTFPLGTGCYYISIRMIAAKRAAPFVSSKLLFSVLLGTWILGERIIVHPRILIGAALLLLGLVLVALSKEKKAKNVSGVRHLQGAMPFLVALGAPLSWSLGEVFIKLGTADTNPITATYYALLAGLASAILMLLPALLLIKRGKTVINGASPKKRGYAFFALHGVLSMAIGYTFYFSGIAKLGVSLAALIVAVWPLLAVPLSMFGERLRGVPLSRRSLIVIPAAFLCFIAEILILTAL